MERELRQKRPCFTKGSIQTQGSNLRTPSIPEKSPAGMVFISPYNINPIVNSSIPAQCTRNLGLGSSLEA